MATLPYAYLSENIPFVSLPRKDFTRLGNSFKKLEESSDLHPFFELAITEEGYDQIYGKEYASKDALFNALDKACYMENGSTHENITMRKILIGIYQNLENMLEPDEEFGTSYYVNTHDPLWNGIQEPDGFYIHCKNNIWFVNKSNDEDIAIDREEDDSEYWDYISHSRADPESDLKRYYLERDNI